MNFNIIIVNYCYYDIQVLEPNSAMRTVLSLDEALISYAQFSVFAATLSVINLFVFAYFVFVG